MKQKRCIRAIFKAQDTSWTQKSVVSNSYFEVFLLAISTYCTRCPNLTKFLYALWSNPLYTTHIQLAMNVWEFFVSCIFIITLVYIFRVFLERLVLTFPSTIHPERLTPIIGLVWIHVASFLLSHDMQISFVFNKTF